MFIGDRSHVTCRIARCGVEAFQKFLFFRLYEHFWFVARGIGNILLLGGSRGVTSLALRCEAQLARASRPDLIVLDLRLRGSLSDVGRAPCNPTRGG